MIRTHDPSIRASEDSSYVDRAITVIAGCLSLLDLIILVNSTNPEVPQYLIFSILLLVHFLWTE
jgi:uncharacterized membrane protein